MAEGEITALEIPPGRALEVAAGDVHSHLELLAEMARSFASMVI